MAWEDILKDDVDTFNKLLKDIKKTQRVLEDVHGVISKLIHSDIVSNYSEVYGGFLPKSLMVEAMDIAAQYNMADVKLEKLMKEVAERMAIYAKRNNPMLQVINMAWKDIVKQEVIKRHEEQIENIIQMLEGLGADMDEDGDYSHRQLQAVEDAIRNLKEV